MLKTPSSPDHWFKHQIKFFFMPRLNCVVGDLLHVQEVLRFYFTAGRLKIGQEFWNILNNRTKFLVIVEKLPQMSSIS